MEQLERFRRFPVEQVAGIDASGKIGDWSMALSLSAHRGCAIVTSRIFLQTIASYTLDS